MMRGREARRAEDRRERSPSRPVSGGSTPIRKAPNPSPTPSPVRIYPWKQRVGKDAALRIRPWLLFHHRPSLWLELFNAVVALLQSKEWDPAVPDEALFGCLPVSLHRFVNAVQREQRGGREEGCCEGADLTEGVRLFLQDNLDPRRLESNGVQVSFASGSSMPSSSVPVSSDCYSELLEHLMGESYTRDEGVRAVKAGARLAEWIANQSAAYPVNPPNT